MATARTTATSQESKGHNLNLLSQRAIIAKHYQEIFHQFIVSPTTREIPLVNASNSISYAFGSARSWLADKLHGRGWRMEWQPPQPPEYAVHTEHYSKVNVTLGKKSSLDYILLEEKHSGKKKLVDIILNTDKDMMRQHLRQGVIHPDRLGALTAQVVAALGRYCLKVTARLLEGDVSSRYRAKEELRVMIQTRIEKLQPLERLLNLHKENPKLHRAAIQAALEHYRKTLKKAFSKIDNNSFKHAAIFEPNIRNEIKKKISADINAARALQIELDDAEQFPTSLAIDQAAFALIKGRIDGNLQEGELRNRNCSYSSADFFAVKGDFHNAIKDAMKISANFKCDHKNPYTAHQQGIVNPDDNLATIRLFDHLPNSSDSITPILARVGLVEGCYAVQFQDQPQQQAPVKKNRRLKNIRLASGSNSPVQRAVLQPMGENGEAKGNAIPLKIISSTKYNWSHTGNPLTGFLRIAILGPLAMIFDAPLGIVQGVYVSAFGPSTAPWAVFSVANYSYNALNNCLPSTNNNAATSVFNPLIKTANDNQSPHLAWGNGIWSAVSGTFVSLVGGVASGVLELQESFPRETWHNIRGDFALRALQDSPLSYETLLDQILNEFNDECKEIEVKLKELKKASRGTLEKEHPELPQGSGHDKTTITQRQTTFLSPPLADNEKKEDKDNNVVAVESKSQPFNEYIDFHHPHSAYRNHLLEAAGHGLRSTVQAFTHTIIEKHPLMGGIPFIVLGTLSGLACYAPGLTSSLGVSQGYIDFSQSLGALLANGPASITIASSFMMAKVGAALGELLVNGKDSWLVTLVKELNKNPDTAFGYFFMAVSFGKVLIWQPLIPWLGHHLDEDQGTFWPFADGFAGLKIGLIVYHLIENHQRFKPTELEAWKTILRHELTTLYRLKHHILPGQKLTSAQKDGIKAVVETLWNKTTLTREEFKQEIAGVFKARQQATGVVEVKQEEGKELNPTSGSFTGVNAQIEIEVKDNGQKEKDQLQAVKRLQILMLLTKNAEKLPYLSSKTKYYLHHHVRQLFSEDIAKGLYDMVEPPKERSILATTVGDALEYIPVFLRTVIGLCVCSTEGAKKLYELIKRDLASITTATEIMSDVLVNDILRHLGKPVTIIGDAVGRCYSSKGDTSINNALAEDPLYNGNTFQKITNKIGSKTRSLFSLFGRVPGVEPESRGHISAHHAVGAALEQIITEPSSEFKLG